MLDSQQGSPDGVRCRAVVLWIDWYAYHLSRFEGLQTAFGRDGQVVGLEMVGGIGVHAGLKFRENRSPDLPVETLMPDRSWKDASKLRLSWVIWRRLSGLNPEIVLVPGYYTLPAIAAACWARLHDRQSVLMTESTAGDHARSGWKEKMKGKLIHFLFGWAVTGGAAHVRYLRQLKFPADRIAGFYDVVGNCELGESVEWLRRNTTAETYGLPAKYFLFVGRLAHEKNVIALLRAWLTYREQGGTWSLVLAGSGPERQALEEIARASICSADILFAGHKSAQELLPFWSFASCFVLPSTREPWGLVVNEAMAASLPVLVSTRCGCGEDLVKSERNGLLFNPENDAELVRCLQWFERAGLARLASMGAASAEIIEPFSPDSFGLAVAAIGHRVPNRVAQPVQREGTI